MCGVRVSVLRVCVRVCESVERCECVCVCEVSVRERE